MRTNSEFENILIDLAPDNKREIKNAFYGVSANPTRGWSLLINGHLIPNTLIRYREAAICSECVREGWERQIKDITLAENCPYHLRKYISFCKKCHRAFTWINQASLVCTCGNEIESPECSLQDARIEKALLNMIRDRSHEKLNAFLEVITRMRWRHLKNTPSQKRITLAFALGICSRDLKEIEECTIEIAKKFTPHQLKIALSIINERLSKPQNYYILESTRNSLNLKHEILDKPTGNKQIKKKRHRIKISLTRHIKTNFTPRIKKEKRSKKSCSEPPNNEFMKCAVLINRQQGIRLLGTTSVVLQEITAAGLVGHILKRPRRPDLFDQEKLIKLDKEFILIRRLAAELSATSFQIRNAIKILKIRTPVLPHRDMFTTLIPRNEIEPIRKLLAEQRKITRSQKKSSKPLKYIPPTEARSYVNCKQASERLCLPIHIVREFAKQKILEPSYKSTAGAFIFKNDTIDKFHEDFVSLNELSEKVKLPAHLIHTTLKDHSVSPRSAPQMVLSGYTIYKRDEVPLDIIEQLSEKLNNSIKKTEAAAGLGISIGALRLIRSLTQNHLSSDLTDNISPQELAIIAGNLNSYTPTELVLSKTWLNRVDFCQFLLSTGAVFEISIHGTSCISAPDAEKVIKFSKQYFSYKAANEYLGAPSGYCPYLVRRGELSLVHTFPNAHKKLLYRPAVESIKFVPFGRFRRRTDPIPSE